MNEQNAVVTGAGPDQTPLSVSQAQRLFELTQIDAHHFVGRTIAEIGNKFQWQIDPKYLLFKRVCGQVVKTNPSTGVAEAVAFATVFLEGVASSKAEPVSIEGETGVIAWNITDACGRFCLWIPRFEIEWTLRHSGVEAMAGVPSAEVQGLFFLVTQDVDGTGTQATIYPRAVWEVPQVHGGIPEVVLQASMDAVSRADFPEDAELCGSCAACSNGHCRG